MKRKPIPTRGPSLMELPESALTKAKMIAKIRGHAAPPGSGPEGETCRSCLHIERVHLASTYIKCGLMRARWTGGDGTDVRASDPACSKWEKGKESLA